MNDNKFDIDCVLIGVNAASTVGRCIESIYACRYDRGQIHVYYVDGGSDDDSVAIAGSFPEVGVIELHPEFPSPGMGRNAGWKAGKSPMVQFLDSDTVLDENWFENAVNALGNGVVAVQGNIREMNPDASVFNWIGSLEWNATPGECDAFGGSVLIERRVLEETGGYDEVLVGGEDPELSQRVRQAGGKILQLDVPMVSHDLAMMTIRQYWRRSFRTGYGFAAVTMRHLLKSRSFWVYEVIRIITRGGGFLALSILALLGAPWHMGSLVLLVPAFFLLFYPLIFSVKNFMAEKRLSRAQAEIYALHCSLIVIPEFFGVMRFFAGAVCGKPLRNKRAVLKTMVSGGMRNDEL